MWGPKTPRERPSAAPVPYHSTIRGWIDLNLAAGVICQSMIRGRSYVSAAKAPNPRRDSSQLPVRQHRVHRRFSALTAMLS